MSIGIQEKQISSFRIISFLHHKPAGYIRQRKRNGISQRNRKRLVEIFNPESAAYIIGKPSYQESAYNCYYRYNGCKRKMVPLFKMLNAPYHNLKKNSEYKAHCSNDEI